MVDPQAVGDGRTVELRHSNGERRTVLVIDREVPFPDGKLIVSRTDLEGRITHANAAFVEMSAYGIEELIGQPHHILRHPDMPAAAFADLWQTVARGEAWHGVVKNLRKDGAHYWVFATVIPNLRDGRIVGYTSVRRKPSRSRIEACTALYREMRERETTA